MDEAIRRALESELQSVRNRSDEAGKRRAAEIAAALRGERGEQAAPVARRGRGAQQTTEA
jgi:hypothetical protein